MDRDWDDDSQRANESAQDEATVDLNAVFPEEEKDLNRLFPDSGLRRLLTELRKNKRDIERFLERLEIDSEVPEESGGNHEVPEV